MVEAVSRINLGETLAAMRKGEVKSSISFGRWMLGRDSPGPWIALLHASRRAIRSPAHVRATMAFFRSLPGNSSARLNVDLARGQREVLLGNLMALTSTSSSHAANILRSAIAWTECRTSSFRLRPLDLAESLFLRTAASGSLAASGTVHPALGVQ